MGKPIVGRRFFGRAQMCDVGDVGAVPERESGDDKVEAGGAKLLRLAAAVGDPALLEGADDLRQGMTLLTLVEARVAAPANSGLSSQSSMNSVRSIRPSSCGARSSWF